MADVRRRRQNAGAEGMLAPSAIPDPATRAVVDSMQRAIDAVARTVNAPAARTADPPEKKLHFMAPVVEAGRGKIKLFGRTATFKGGELEHVSGVYTVKAADVGSGEGGTTIIEGGTTTTVIETLYAMPMTWLDQQA